MLKASNCCCCESWSIESTELMREERWRGGGGREERPIGPFQSIGPMRLIKPAYQAYRPIGPIGPIRPIWPHAKSPLRPIKQIGQAY